MPARSASVSTAKAISARSRRAKSWRIFWRRLKSAGHERKSHLLSRRHFVLVLLGGTGVGGTEAALRECAGGIQLENRFAGRIRHVEVAGAGGLVLPAQRNNHALAVHAQFRLDDRPEGIS